MEEKFAQAWMKARMDAEALGVRMRPLEAENAMKEAKRCLSGHRQSDGFHLLAQKGRLDLSLEALAVSRQFTALFDDDQANEALTRLMDAGYRF